MLLVISRNPTVDVVLLVCHNKTSRWPHDMIVGDDTWVRPARKCHADDIDAATIYAFKGPERPVVILAELEELHGPEGDRLIYVGLSRARNDVYVVGEMPGIDQVSRSSAGKRSPN